MKKLIITFILYLAFYANLGNTIIRIDSYGNKRLSLIPLFTEGFIGPIRTLYLNLRYNGIYSFMTNLRYEFFRLSNPYSCYIFVNYIYQLIKQNLN